MRVCAGLSTLPGAVCMSSRQANADDSRNSVDLEAGHERTAPSPPRTDRTCPYRRIDGARHTSPRWPLTWPGMAEDHQSRRCVTNQRTQIHLRKPSESLHSSSRRGDDEQYSPVLYLERSACAEPPSVIASTARVEVAMPPPSRSQPSILGVFMRDRFGFDMLGRMTAWHTKLIAYSVAITITPLAASCSTDTHVPPRAVAPAKAAQVIRPVSVSAAELARLPKATTFTRLRGAPKD